MPRQYQDDGVLNTPVHKNYILSVQKITDDVECLSLIVQVLELYPGVDRAWIARCLSWPLPKG
jgi:hypothetical protein